MRNNRYEEGEQENLNGNSDLLTYLIGVPAVIIIVIVYCLVVWNVTHAHQNRLTTKEDTVNIQETSNNLSGSGAADVAEPQDTAEPEETGEDDTEPAVSTEENTGIAFEERNETVTAIDVVNLRSEPSTDGGNATVVGTLSNGNTVTRIGINEELGWSMLDYNGQTVYAATRYLTVVEQ